MEEDVVEDSEVEETTEESEVELSDEERMQLIMLPETARQRRRATCSQQTRSFMHGIVTPRSILGGTTLLMTLGKHHTTNIQDGEIDLWSGLTSKKLIAAGKAPTSHEEMS
eukprot:10572992-Ditylum_brightwellii.AAC.1